MQRLLYLIVSRLRQIPSRHEKCTCIRSVQSQHHNKDRLISCSKSFFTIDFLSSSRSLSNYAFNVGENANATSKSDTIVNKGESLYILAIDALRKAEETKKNHEERLMREQFEAVSRQRLRTQQREEKRHPEQGPNPTLQKADSSMQNEITRERAAGVALVKTIIKQSQSKAVHLDQYVDSNEVIIHDESGHSTHGHGEDHWRKKARDCMEEAAYRYGHSLALVRLGNDALKRSAKESSSGAPLLDQEKLITWSHESPMGKEKLLSLSANAENPSLLCDNTLSTSYDQYLTPHQKIAAFLYEEAGKRGSSEGWYNLGHLLWDSNDTGMECCNLLREHALEAFYKSIELGDADAQYFLSVLYLSCDDEGCSDSEHESLLRNAAANISQNLTETLQPNSDFPTLQPLEFRNNLQAIGYSLLLAAALQKGHGPAIHHLALLHHQMNEKSDDEFHKLLKQAASTHHPESLLLMGHSQYNGTDGFKQDFKAALDNFLAAAELGNVDAMVSAGAMLHKGVCSQDGRSVIVGRDQQRAFDLYQKAGELGSIEGWRNVVACYATGEGVPKSMEIARHIAKTMLNDERTDGSYN